MQWTLGKRLFPMLDHKPFSKETGVKVFFAKSYAGGLREATENTNVRIRRVLPK